MDIGNASLLAFVVFLLVEFAKLIYPKLAGPALAIFLIVAGQVTAFAVAHSDWGKTQVVKGLHLDTMNGVSLALVGLAVAGLAAAGNKVFVQAVSRIGSNGEL